MAKLHDLRLPRVDLRQLVERLIEREDFDVERAHETMIRQLDRDHLVLWDPLTGIHTSSVVDQNAPHGDGRGTEKMPAIVPHQSVPVEKAKIRLVDDFGRAQGMARSFSPKEPRGDPTHLRIDEGDQPLHGAISSAPQLAEELRHLPFRVT